MCRHETDKAIKLVITSYKSIPVRRVVPDHVVATFSRLYESDGVVFGCVV